MATRSQDPSEKLGRFRRGPDPEPEVPPPKPRFPHDVPIRVAGVSVDRKTLVALDAQGFVNGWDTVKAKRLYRLPLIDPREVPQRLTFSGDGRYVALSPWSLPAGLVRVLDPHSGKELRRFDRGFSPSFSPDGNFLACTDEKQLRRWALKNGAEMPRFPEAESPLKWTAWSPTNFAIAASHQDSPRVAVWDPANGRRMFLGAVSAKEEAASSLAFSPDGKMLAVGSHWGINFVGLGGLPEKEYFGHEEYALGQLKFSADGQRLSAMSRQRRLLVWETFTGKPLLTWAAYAVEDGRLEISEGGDVGIWIERGGIRLERLPQLLAGADDGHVVRNLTFTPAGTLVTGDDSGMIRIWDPATEKELRRFKVPLVRLRYFSRDGAWALFGGEGDPIGIWDLVTGMEVLKANPSPAVWSVALSPDNRLLALGHCDGTVALWTIAEKKELTRIRSDMAGITALVWSSDGKSLAWGDDSGAVAMAEGRQGRDPVRFRARDGAVICHLKFSPDGRRLAATDKKGNCRIYSEPGVEPEEVPNLSWDPWLPDPRWRASGCFQKSFVGVVQRAISLDHTYIADATRDGKLVIWEAPGGK